VHADDREVGAALPVIDPVGAQGRGEATRKTAPVTRFQSAPASIGGAGDKAG